MGDEEKKVRQDFLGRTFGRLRIVGRYHGPSRRIVWKALCECGKVLYVRHDNLEHGRTTSCGCLHREITSKRSYKHGLRNTPEYRSWLDMRECCHNEKNPRYSKHGALGIKICERWDDFNLFLEDMGPKPTRLKGLKWRRKNVHFSIYRKNKEDDYTPENCSWQPMLGGNLYRESDPLLQLAGMTMPLAEWSEYIEIPRRVLQKRLERGWSVKRALTEDYRPHRKSRL